MATRARRDLSAERRQEILDAFRRCVARDGLQASSLRRIGAEAGLGQSVLVHHFGSRDGLVKALIDSLVAGYAEAVAAHVKIARAESGVEALLQFLFAGAFSKISERDQGLFTELHATGSRDQAVALQLKKVYGRLVTQIDGVLRKSFPAAEPQRARQVAYALMCLAEGDDLCRGIGVAGRRNRDALEMARVLVGSLE